MATVRTASKLMASKFCYVSLVINLRLFNLHQNEQIMTAALMTVTLFLLMLLKPVLHNTFLQCHYWWKSPSFTSTE